MGGGGESTAERYAKFGAGKYTSSDFERYVDSRPDLAAAWAKIESDPTAWDSKYWIDKGATSKAAFGRAHAAEDAALYAGTYGDSGDTKVLPGTPEYEAYFGDGGGTYFDSFISSPSGEGGGGGGSSSAPYAANPFYPQLVPEYTPQGLLDWSAYMPVGGLFGHGQYQPWTNPNAIPVNLFYYQPPTIHAGSGISGGGISGGGISGGGISGGGSSGGYSGGSSGVPSGGYSGGSSGSVSYTPVGNISTGSSSSDGDVYTPFMPDNVVAGAADINIPGGYSDPVNTYQDVRDYQDTFTGYDGIYGTTGEYLQDKVDQQKQASLIDYKPELAEDFYSIGLGGDYRADQAQANIDATIREIQKANPKTIFGPPPKTALSGYVVRADEAHLARPDR